MPPKPLTPAEKLVARKMPKDPTYFDQVMARYVKEDGTTCGRAEPVDNWLRPAFRDAKKKGLIRLANKMSINGGRAFGIYHLTERGRPIAHASKETIVKTRAERQQWGLDFQAARRELIAAKESENSQHPETPEP